MAGSRHVSALLLGLIGLAAGAGCLLAVAHYWTQAPVGPGLRAAARTTVQTGSPARANSGARAACSARNPFSPPLLITLAAPGTLLFDRLRNLAVVVRSVPGSDSAVDSVAEFGATTGRSVRTGSSRRRRARKQL